MLLFNTIADTRALLGVFALMGVFLDRGRLCVKWLLVRISGRKHGPKCEFVSAQDAL